MVQTIFRILFGLVLVLTPLTASAQVGRVFVSAEAYAGASRVIYFGKIVELQRIDYEKPLTDTQKLGKRYRLVFEVAETVRGEKLQRLELVLALQVTIYLEYMHDHALELMLATGPIKLGSYPHAEIGVEEQGKRVDGEWYHFRVLDRTQPSQSGVEKQIANQINLYYDQSRIFTSELDVVTGGEETMKHVRDFARKHPQTLSTVSLRVPNQFGALCGAPNAFCEIILPICPETKAKLDAIKADPGLILRRIQSGDDEDYNQKLVPAEIDRALAQFSSDDRK